MLDSLMLLLLTAGLAFAIAHGYRSCLEILSQNTSATSGYYSINLPSQYQLRVWCDMSTDAAAGYTMFACLNCPSVNQVTQYNGCMALGLNMVVPRSQAHWQSLFNFVDSLPAATNGAANHITYFHTIPGVYKPLSGCSSCLGGGDGIMNSGNCSSIPYGWRSIDGGKWWLRDTGVAQPDGCGGGYTANCFLINNCDGYCNTNG